MQGASQGVVASGRVSLVPGVIQMAFTDVTCKVLALTARATTAPSASERFRWAHVLNSMNIFEMHRHILARNHNSHRQIAAKHDADEVNCPSGVCITCHISIGAIAR